MLFRSTEVYNGSYAASQVESPSSTAPNMSGFNLPTFPSIHNFSTGPTSTSHRTVCYSVLLCRTDYLTHSLEHISRVLSCILPLVRQVVSHIAIAAPTSRRARGSEKGKFRADNPSQNIKVCYIYNIFSLQ